YNTAPVISNVPIAEASVGEVLNFNLAAYDSDGDVLKYSFFDSELSGYEFPADVEVLPVCEPNELTIDAISGDIKWNTPCKEGIFLLPVLIDEYRDGNLISSIQVYVLIYVGVNSGVAITNTNAQPDLNVYPNPASELITINFPEQTNFIHILNLNGSMVRVISVSEFHEQALNIKNIISGIYMIRCYGNYGVSTSTFIKL
ncbi:MAG: T9SS type A sorting domain-containing protein, partial [Fimbriimonadaceae bacterium]|nr:T9SS type A sorting domain-containing protein [Chitinophagales bacterium]